MSKVKPSKLLKNAQLWTTKHSPEILVGLGITGMVTTTVLAVKATPKALMLIEEKKKEEQAEKLLENANKKYNEISFTYENGLKKSEEWCIINETSQLKVVITVGTDTVSHIWYIKYIQSTDSFLPERSVIKPATIVNFLAREYNDNIQDFNFINTEYNYNNEQHTISADLNIINKNAIVKER